MCCKIIFKTNPPVSILFTFTANLSCTVFLTTSLSTTLLSLLKSTSIWFIFYDVFFINPTIKIIIITFPFDMQFIFFCLNYFLFYKFFLICFLRFFFIKSSNIFLPLRSLITEAHGTVFLILLITKTSSDQFVACPLAKCFFILNFSIFFSRNNFGFSIKI